MQPYKSFEILVGSQGGGAGIAVIADIAVIARNRKPSLNHKGHEGTQRKRAKPTPIWDGRGGVGVPERAYRRNPTPAGQKQPDLGTPVIAVIGKAKPYHLINTDDTDQNKARQIPPPRAAVPHEFH